MLGTSKVRFVCLIWYPCKLDLKFEINKTYHDNIKASAEVREHARFEGVFVFI